MSRIFSLILKWIQCLLQLTKREVEPKKKTEKTKENKRKQ